MKDAIQHLKLEHKLILMITIITLSVLLIIGLTFRNHQKEVIRQDLQEQLSLAAEVLGESSAAAIRFRVPEDARAVLNSLSPLPSIVAAHIYSPDGKVFASYKKVEEDPPALSILVAQNGFTVSEEFAVLSRPIVHDGDQIGFIRIISDLSDLHAKYRSTLQVLLAALVGCFFLASLLTHLFLKMITPLLRHLIDVSTRISETGDYSIRAEPVLDDDLNLLVKRYNGMLEHIENNERQLKQEQAALKESRDRERALRGQLSRSERMESLGLLAGGVAHDLNNILGPLVGYPDILLEEMGSDDRFRKEIEQMKLASVKAAAVIQDLLALSRRGNYKLEPLQLKRLVEEYKDSITFKSLCKRYPKVKYVFELEPETPTVLGSPYHLSQVLMNLTYNAAEAMPNGGTLKIRSSALKLQTEKPGLEWVPAGSYAVLDVEDNGIGMREEHQAHIFEPFYSRKKMGNSGSGLGLSVVYGIVKDLNGFIHLESVENKGTRFRLFFPETMKEKPQRNEEGGFQGGSESILIVDDLDVQRQLASRILEGAGYQVHTAESGQDAVEIASKSEFDLIMLDMIMEDGFDGLDTFRALRKIRSDQACIMVSGFSESDRVKQAQREGAGDFLAKPYSRDQLLKTVRTQLDLR